MNTTSNISQMQRAAAYGRQRGARHRSGIGSVIIAALALAGGAGAARGADEIRLGQTVQLENGRTFTAEKWGANWGDKKVVIGTFHDPPNGRTYGSTPMQCDVVRGDGRRVPDVYLNCRPTGPIKLSKDQTFSSMVQTWRHEKYHRDVQPLDTRVNPGLNNFAARTLSPAGYQSWLRTQGLTRDQGELRANLAEMSSRDFRSPARNAQFSQGVSWGEHRRETMRQVADLGASAYFQAKGKSLPIDNSYYDVNRGCVVKGSGPVDPGKAATVLSVWMKTRPQDFKGVSPSLSVPSATVDSRFRTAARPEGTFRDTTSFSSAVSVSGSPASSCRVAPRGPTLVELTDRSRNHGGGTGPWPIQRRHSASELADWSGKYDTPLPKYTGGYSGATAGAAFGAPNLNTPGCALPAVHSFATPRFEPRSFAPAPMPRFEMPRYTPPPSFGRH